MYRALVLLAIALGLAGCGSSGAAPKPTSTAKPHTIAHVVTLVPGGKGAQVKKLPKGTRPAKKVTRLPTAQTFATATPPVIAAADFTSTIYGTVRDAKSHSPLSGALVVIALPGHRMQVKTSPFGAYSIKVPAAHLFPVSVSMQGYLGKLLVGKVSPHRRYKLDVNLPRQQPGKAVAPPPPGLFGSH